MKQVGLFIQKIIGYFIFFWILFNGVEYGFARLFGDEFMIEHLQWKSENDEICFRWCVLICSILTASASLSLKNKKKVRYDNR